MLATGSCCCCCTWLFKKAASGKETPCYWRATATAAAVPTMTRPSRTGKHHGPEGRTESKICVSRGRNVPSEISYKKLAIRFSRLAAGSLLAAALLPLRLLLRLLVFAAAYWCLLLPAAACCLLLPAAPCCCLLLVLLLVAAAAAVVLLLIVVVVVAVVVVGVGGYRIEKLATPAVSENPFPFRAPPCAAGVGG